MAATLQVEGVRRELHWLRAFALGFVIVLMGVAFGMVVWQGFCWQWTWNQVTVGLVSATALGLGITVYLHRYRTHKAFEFSSDGIAGVAAKLVEWLLNCAALAAFQGTAVRWASWHDWHHQHSDQEDDLHSPLKNWFWAHGCWLVYAPDPDPAALRKFFRPGRVSRMLDTYPGMLIFGPGLALGLSFWAAGWMGMVWYLAGACVSWHVTGCINSVCHKAPRSESDCPNPDTGDYSRNNFLLGFLGFGEGWHHNHHRGAKSAKFGNRWWQIDKGYYFISFMKLCGVVGKVRTS